MRTHFFQRCHREKRSRFFFLPLCPHGYNTALTITDTIDTWYDDRYHTSSNTLDQHQRCELNAAFAKTQAQRHAQQQSARGLQAGQTVTEVRAASLTSLSLQGAAWQDGCRDTCTAAAKREIRASDLIPTYHTGGGATRLPIPRGRSRSCGNVYAAALTSWPGAVQHHGSYEHQRHSGPAGFFFY